METMAPPLPRFAIRGTASEAQRKKPLRWVATTAEKSAKEIFPMSPTRWIPALLTRMSICPASLSIVRNAAATLSGLVMSVSRYVTPSRCSSGLSLSSAKTCAPSCARRAAIPSPMPRAAPVTAATCPDRDAIAALSCSIHQPAAADVDRCPGNVVGVIGRQEENGAGELRGARHVAKRDLRDGGRKRRLVQSAPHHGRIGRARRAGVHRDLLLGQRARKSASHRDDSAFGRRVGDRTAEAAALPPLGGEVDDAAALAHADHRARRGLGEKERGLQIDVVLDVPVRLAYIEDTVAADQHRRGLDQDVETAEFGDDAIHERLVSGDGPQVMADGDVRAAFHVSHDGVGLRLSDIDSRYASAGGGEGKRDLSADAARGAGQKNRLSLQPRAEIESHISTSAPLPAPRRRERRLFVNEAGLRLAHEFLPVLDQHGPKRLGCESLLRRLDAVEPDLADAIPGGLLGRPALHLAEAQSADSGQLPHDVGMRSGPVREEFLAAHAVLAPEEAHALDHQVAASRSGGCKTSSVTPS